jgi:enamine deaminase RidA (YjgF/YER057c/UK114 family)
MTHPQIINPAYLPDPTPFGYSTAVIAPAGARIAHISGQGGFDRTGALPEDFAAQVALALGNLQAVLDALGAAPAQVVKLTLYVVDHDVTKLPILTEAIITTFAPTLPAQTLVPVPALALPGMLFEVEAVAVLED